MKLLAALAVALLFAGCKSSSSIELGISNPTFEIVGSGVKFEGEYIMPQEAPKILKRYQVPEDRVIYIRVAEFEEFNTNEGDKTFYEGKAAINDSYRFREARAFMAVLWRAGYHKSVLVTKEQSSSWSRNDSGDEEEFSSGNSSRRSGSKKKAKIRYRSADEDDED